MCLNRSRMSLLFDNLRKCLIFWILLTFLKKEINCSPKPLGLSLGGGIKGGGSSSGGSSGGAKSSGHASGGGSLSLGGGLKGIVKGLGSVLTLKFIIADREKDTLTNCRPDPDAKPNSEYYEEICDVEQESKAPTRKPKKLSTTTTPKPAEAAPAEPGAEPQPVPVETTTTTTEAPTTQPAELTTTAAPTETLVAKNQRPKTPEAESESKHDAYFPVSYCFGEGNQSHPKEFCDSYIYCKKAKTTPKVKDCPEGEFYDPFGKICKKDVPNDKCKVCNGKVDGDEIEEAGQVYTCKKSNPFLGSIE